MIRKIIFGVLAFSALFAGCDKKTSNAKKQFLVICDISYKIPTARLFADFKQKTGIEPVITIVPGEEILAMVKLGRAGDILIAGEKYIEYISNSGELAAFVELGFAKSKDGRRIYATGLNYSKNGMEIIQFIEFARVRGPKIFAEHGFAK